MPLELWVRAAHAKLRIVELPVRISHVVRVALLPLHHRDPFDRLLVAQAQSASLTVVSADPVLAQYDVKVTW